MYSANSKQDKYFSAFLQHVSQNEWGIALKLAFKLTSAITALMLKYRFEDFINKKCLNAYFTRFGRFCNYEIAPMLAKTGAPDCLSKIAFHAFSRTQIYLGYWGRNLDISHGGQFEKIHLIADFWQIGEYSLFPPEVIRSI